MTLGLTLVAAAEEPAEILSACRHLVGAVPAEIPLRVIGAGLGAEIAARLTETVGRERIVLLDRTECPMDIACALVRQQTGQAHVLPLRPGDRLAAGAAAGLATWLAREDPALALLGGGFHLGDGAAPLPGTPVLDAARPDPRRLLPRGGCAPQIDPFADPAAAWAAWESALDGSAPALFEAPVLLRPLPQASALPALTELGARLKTAPRGAAPALLARLAPWLDDALAMAPAGHAFETAAAALALRAALPRALRREAAALPGATGALLRADTEAAALAVLGLLASARQDRIAQALAAGQAQLRRDLDLALPGPEYLADLYARVRGL
ncbi:hypothetical protein [Salipiger aestuarii]|uniref:hypothetical protein n=1 Tax=Salipiger aestuarii TaxID=568098 RepID=UPI00123A388E|nr:hypothetical protein [Salipiger aestuarii]KAA8610016.1 hypothetical protein AL037_14260 [Salipiger aestuarii]